MNIDRGFIVGFNCCLEGRQVSRNSSGKYENSDGEIVSNSWHPFLIISHKNKNNAPMNNYFSAIPITSSSTSDFSQQNGILLTKDMFSSRGISLTYNKSLIKIDRIVSIHKKDYKEEMRIIAEINPLSRPYKQILSKVIKNFGCDEII